MKARSVLRAVCRCGAAVGIIAWGIGAVPLASHAVSTDVIPPFSGSASGLGVEFAIVIPGFPATSAPVDSGGPTAQVAADSIGSSTGYAALPDPGQFVTTVPGLLTGLLGGGAAGLPPIKLPTLPNYPLYVSSDVNGGPEQHVGAGPYSLDAKSARDTSTAQAVGGFSDGLFGNAALVMSTASITATPTGVVSTATADMQGLTAGPLTIGEVKSVATETLGSDGTVTPSTSLSISGMRIAGLPVAITPQGLALPGPTEPLPINSTLKGILKGAGITATVVTEQDFPGRVVAPAFVVSMPFTVPDVSTAPGKLTLTIGSATAQLSASTPSSTGGSTPTGSSGVGSLGGTSTSSTTGNGGTTGSDSSGIGTGAAASSAGAPGSGSTSSPGASALGAVTTQGATLTGLVGGFDVRSLYLMLVLGALAALAMGQLIRLLGVRKPWIYNGG